MSTRRNRDDDYGISVSECEAYVHDEVWDLKGFDRRYLAVALSRDEEDEDDPRLFRIGFNWAKSFYDGRWSIALTSRSRVTVVTNG